MHGSVTCMTKMDRVLGDNVAKLACDNFKLPQKDQVPAHDILNATIDAAEQAKFKIPKLSEADSSNEVAGQ